MVGDKVTLDVRETSSNYGEHHRARRLRRHLDKTNLPADLILSNYSHPRRKIVSLVVIHNQPPTDPTPTRSAPLTGRPGRLPTGRPGRSLQADPVGDGGLGSSRPASSCWLDQRAVVTGGVVLPGEAVAP